MLRLLIIGFGNPLRSDDGIGWHVAERLSREVSINDVQIIAAHQLMPEMADPTSRAEHILFIDAARNGTPGTVSCVQVAPGASASPHSHELTPATLLGMASELYGRCPRAHLLTVVGESFEIGETMSPSVVAAIPALMAQIQEFIRGGTRV